MCVGQHGKIGSASGGNRVLLEDLHPFLLPKPLNDFLGCSHSGILFQNDFRILRKSSWLSILDGRIAAYLESVAQLMLQKSCYHS